MIAESDGPQEPAEEPLPAEVMNDPRIRRQIEEAQTSIREGHVTPGKKANDLAKLARERKLESRSRI